MEAIDQGSDIHHLSSDSECHSNSDDTWLRIEGVTLTLEDKDVLSSGEWLNDRLINAALTLKKRDKNLLPVDVLQDPILGNTLSFQVSGSEMVQVLHSGNSHWVTISTVGTSHPEAIVYDSLYATLPFQTKEQVCSLICSKEKEVILKFANVQVIRNSMRV